MRKFTLVSFLLLSIATYSVNVYADAASDVIAITKAQWASEIAREPVDKQLSMLAKDYTEFNPDSPYRINGKAMNTRLWGAFFDNEKGRILAAEMVNEKVQVYGKTAILTYNFIGTLQDKDGKIENIYAKSTRVYVKTKKGWKLVHANFAPAAKAS